MRAIVLAEAEDLIGSRIGETPNSKPIGSSLS